jgi:copper chaperone CopZ
MAMTLQTQCPDIECDGCAQSIRRVLGRVEGVEAVEIGVTEKRVAIQFDPSRTSEALLRERLTKAGFPPSG